jgi:hypothetical protein
MQSKTIGMMRALFALVILCGTADAREMTLLPFSFQVPDSWTVEGNGRDQLYASAATQPNHPPYMLAEACALSPQSQCVENGFQQPFGDDEKSVNASRSLGCYGIKGVAIPRKDGVTETRWICSTVAGPDDSKITAGFSFFKTRGAVLRVSYLAGAKDQDVQSFLDAFARSLKAR